MNDLGVHLFDQEAATLARRGTGRALLVRNPPVSAAEYQDGLHTLARRAWARCLGEAVPKVTEALRAAFWHFWHPIG